MLKKILNELQWTPYGIACPDAKTAHTVHKFLREAVLDRHIYLSKIIGFAVKSSTHFSVYSGTYIARHVQLGESYPELTVKLSDKIYYQLNLLHPLRPYLSWLIHSDNPLYYEK